MKRRDLLRRLAREAKTQDVSWVLDHEGGRHSVYRLGTRMVPVPRHSEIGEGLARQIFVECEPELGKGWWRS